MRKKMMGGGMMQKPMYKDGGKIKKPKVKKIIAGGMGKAKDYPGIKKIMEMNKEGRKKFKMGGSVEDKIRKIGLEVKANPLPKKTKNLLGKLKKAYSKRPGKKMGGSLKSVPAGNKGLKKLPTEVRNKMGFMKKGGVVSDTKKKQFKANKNNDFFMTNHIKVVVSS